jgi:hypothetical protein
VGVESDDVECGGGEGVLETDFRQAAVAGLADAGDVESLSGSGCALPRRRPLRTVRAGWPRTRLKQALWLTGRQKYGPIAGVGDELSSAVGVQELGGWFVRLARPGDDDRLAGDPLRR